MTIVRLPEKTDYMVYYNSLLRNFHSVLIIKKLMAIWESLQGREGLMEFKNMKLRWF